MHNIFMQRYKDLGIPFKIEKAPHLWRGNKGSCGYVFAYFTLIYN